MDLIKNSRIITAENIDSDNTILLENSTSDATRSGVIFKVNKDIIASQEYVSSFTSEMVRTYKAQGISSLEIPTGITYKGVEVYTNTYKNWGDMGWNRVLGNDYDFKIILNSKKVLTKKLLEKIKNIKDELFLNKDNAGTIIELLTK